MSVALLALLGLVPGPAQLSPASKPVVEELLRRIDSKDAAGLDRPAGYLFFKSNYWPNVFAAQPERISAVDFLKSIDGCGKGVGEIEYSQIVWTCKGRVAANEGSEIKYKNCFDVEPILRVYMQDSNIIPVVYYSSRWSSERCGESPVFVPAPPTMPEKK